ncbi:MAG: sulfotransferase [Ilumatobacteraceae bacterium]
MSPSQPDGPAPFLFLVGCGRSGTTLLRAMCDAHPELAVPPESHVLVTLAPRGADAFDPIDGGSLAGCLAADERFGLWGLDATTLRDVIGPAPADYPTAIRAVFRAWTEDHAGGQARYADKTPVYVLHIARLAELFPEAVFVHLVRDGRDVAASFLELGWADTIEDAALHWKLRVTRGRRAGRRLAPGRYVEVHYEDLVGEPERTLRTICAAAGLAYDGAMLDPSGSSADIVATTRHPEYHGHLTRPPTAGLRDWRRDLDVGDVARFEALAGATLGAFGYERAVPGPTLATRAAAAAHLARWQVHRVRRRLTGPTSAP